MRVALIAVVVLCCALAAQAKLVSVSGQGVILTTPPANVYDKGPNDVPSATLGGALAITSFDEKLRVVLDDPLQISSDVTLQPNLAYDSFFLFFHQKSTDNDKQSATADFTVDNRVIGCTDSIQREFDSTPVFGKAGVLYPTTSGQVNGARGFEAQDGVVGLGTVYTSNNTITQPGDYTRCFTHSCADSNGDACSCSPSLDACLTPQNDQYHCFDDAQALASLPQFSLSSTCVVDKSSAVITVKSCDSAKGCRRDGAKVCLRSSSNGVPSSVDLHVTGGCSCSADITATFNSQATGRGCYPADTTLGCKTGANVLVYGRLTNHGAIDSQNKWAAWLQSVVPGSTVTWSAPTSPITASLLSGYDLLITAQLSRVVDAAEAAAVEAYVNNGGALIALAGFINTQTDINQQQSVLSGFGISFVNSLITITSNANNWVYNPANPLNAGLQGKWVSYAGGWPSTPIPGGVLFGQESLSTNPWNPNLPSVGQTIVLPSGGKIVAWGDEWATFLDQYDSPNNGNSIFWKNAVSWVSNICVSNAPCDANKFTVSSSCTAVSHTSSGKGFTLSFSDSASNCN